jgi:hypothetical protein
MAPHFPYLGVIFGPNGIDEAEQVKLLATRARKALSVIVSLGANGNGFSPRVRLNLYTSMIRSCLEYGLSLFKNMESIQALENVQLE